MTISPPLELLGVQTPRVSSVPPFVASSGPEVVQLAKDVGLVLDPWQRLVLEGGLGERSDGKWAAFEVDVTVPRQNGKGGIIEARELGGLFLFGEELQLHTAHEFKTAQEAFRRVLFYVENFDWLRKKVKRVRTSHGEEGIELLTGQRLRFVARSGGSGRGFTGDTVYLDEKMILAPQAMAALLPTLSARPNPQVWYFGSAGFPDSEVQRRLRERGMAGDDPSLAFFEWSADPKADPDDVDAWRFANPALGIRIPAEFVERERAAMPEIEFARERLGIWDDGRREMVLPAEAWESAADPDSQALDPVAFAVDVTPDRKSTSIAVAGRRADGLIHVEVVENRKGTGWAAARVDELRSKTPTVAVALDPSAGAGSLLPEMETLGIDPLLVSGREMAQACGRFYDTFVGYDDEKGVHHDGTGRHLDQPPLNSALGAARKRPMGDAWAWHRRDLTDISPLVAATLAVHAFVKVAAAEKPKRSRVPVSL